MRTRPKHRLVLLAALVSTGLTACGGSSAGSDEAQPSASAGGDEGETASPPEPAPAAGLLAEGTEAPDFSIPDQTGTARSLSAERGHPVVLYFYPRDATPGCTREACGFRDAWTRYEAAGAQVFGVSMDDVDSHRAFAEEHELPFPLLADTEAEVADAYGVSHETGVDERVTFLISPNGTIIRVFPEVDPGVHADEVLAAIAEAGVE